MIELNGSHVCIDGRQQHVNYWFSSSECFEFIALKISFKGSSLRWVIGG